MTASSVLKLAPTFDKMGRCGTNAGYYAHRDRGEASCDSCRRARTERQSRVRGSWSDERRAQVRAKERVYDARRYSSARTSSEGQATLRAKWGAENRRRHLDGRGDRRTEGRTVPGAPVTAEGLRARFAYFGDRCWVCRVPLTSENRTKDHVKPLAAGGLHVHANLRPACRSCNSAKGDRWDG